jgi:predicted nucleic acid-binding Zn ribbon protein
MALSAVKDASAVVEAAMGGGKPVSMTHRNYIPKGSTAETLASVGKGGTSYWDPKKKQYYKVVHETMSAQEWQQQYGGGDVHPIADPNRLWTLVRAEVPMLGRKATLSLIRAQNPAWKNWTPGKK